MPGQSARPPGTITAHGHSGERGLNLHLLGSYHRAMCRSSRMVTARRRLLRPDLRRLQGAPLPSQNHVGRALGECLGRAMFPPPLPRVRLLEPGLGGWCLGLTALRWGMASWGSRGLVAPQLETSSTTLPLSSRELLIAPRVQRMRTRGRPQSSVTGTRASNRAFQSRLYLDGLMRWTPAKFWRFRRISHSKPRRRLHQRLARPRPRGW